MRCNESCLDDVCTCQPTKVVQELREDATGKLTLRSIITPEYRKRIMADWVGGIGDEPVFGEPV